MQGVIKGVYVLIGSYCPRKLKKCVFKDHDRQFENLLKIVFEFLFMSINVPFDFF